MDPSHIWDECYGWDVQEISVEEAPDRVLTPIVKALNGKSLEESSLAIDDTGRKVHADWSIPEGEDPTDYRPLGHKGAMVQEDTERCLLAVTKEDLRKEISGRERVTVDPDW